MNSSLERSIFKLGKKEDFELLCQHVFDWQFQQNKIYREFVIGTQENSGSLPFSFLPVEFFKTTKVYASTEKPELEFKSSGTAKSGRSRHLVKSSSIYQQSFIKTFSSFYGNPENYAIVALLPSYLESGDSSLVHMTKELIGRSKYAESDFYLDDFQKLDKCLEGLAKQNIPTIFIGVSYALLDFSEKFGPLKNKNLVVMETGGMKGRKKEILRAELHGLLKKRLGVTAIHSEYGMTELLSQAYSSSAGIFYTPPWMDVIITAQDDPFEILDPGKIGRINIIDLANLYSCSFIATQDLGRLHTQGGFEVLGRVDYSEARGCNLLYTE